MYFGEVRDILMKDEAGDPLCSLKGSEASRRNNKRKGCLKRSFDDLLRQPSALFLPHLDIFCFLKGSASSYPCMFSLFLFIGLTVAAHLFKLWAAQISPHSTVIFRRPLNKKRWNCWLCLICPSTGSFSVRCRSFFRGQPFPNFLPLLFFQRNVDGFCVFVFGACRLKRASATCRTTIRPFDGDVPVVGRFVPFIHKP